MNLTQKLVELKKILLQTMIIVFILLLKNLISYYQKRLLKD